MKKNYLKVICLAALIAAILLGYLAFALPIGIVYHQAQNENTLSHKYLIDCDVIGENKVTIFDDRIEPFTYDCTEVFNNPSIPHVVEFYYQSYIVK